jgi:eukaryotic-like serine/threonine-protein kinase
MTPRTVGKPRSRPTGANAHWARAVARRGRRPLARGEVEQVVVGETVLGRFVLEERIGAGGFGTVYRAWDERLQRSVAVKVIEARGDAGRRVLREAQAAARLNHRGIVTLYELGEDGRRAYLVSELAEGATLDELARDGRISDREVAEVGVELCDALDHAHASGVVHRDIKPQNITVQPSGAQIPAGAVRSKLMDFGIARLRNAPALTPTGEVMGTIAYMAPEQAEGAPATAATDTYSLALTLYECWAGENPVVRSTPAATARAIGEPLPPLCRLRPDLPRRLSDALDACLAPDPEERPTIEELGSELDEAIPGLDPHRAVPADGEPSRADPRIVHLARVAALVALAGAIAWLALIAGRPGAAVVVGALLAPVPLLLDRPLRWGMPVLAPLLGVVGLAPLFPALAALAGTPGRRFVLAWLGWAWLAVAEAVFGTTLLFASLEPPPTGWTLSVEGATSGILLPLLAPGALLAGLLWGAAAIVLGQLVRGRIIALELLGVLVWAAALVAIHRLLAGGEAAPAAAPVALGAVAVALLALYLRTHEGALQAGRASRGLA